MSWLKEDDHEAEHPKTLALIADAGPDAYYRLHRLRQWCARNRTRGRFTEAVARELLIKPPVLKAMVGYSLVDLTSNGGYVVHNYERYNSPPDPGAVERKRRQRARDKTVTEGVTNARLTRDNSVTEA